MTTNIPTKKIKNSKVYGLVIEAMDTIFLSIQYAYSLEEAFALAKFEFEEQVLTKKLASPNPLVGAKIGLFCIKSIKQLTSEPGWEYKKKLVEKKYSEEIEKVSEAFKGINSEIKLIKTAPKIKLSEDPKNKLMKQIIQNKDFEKFEKNRLLLTEYERNYIKDRLK